MYRSCMSLKSKVNFNPTPWKIFTNQSCTQFSKHHHYIPVHIMISVGNIMLQINRNCNPKRPITHFISNAMSQVNSEEIVIQNEPRYKQNQISIILKYIYSPAMLYGLQGDCAIGPMAHWHLSGGGQQEVLSNTSSTEILLFHVLYVILLQMRSRSTLQVQLHWCQWHQSNCTCRVDYN